MKICKSIADIFGKAYKEVDLRDIKLAFLEQAKKMFNTYSCGPEDSFVLYSCNAENYGAEQQVYTRTRFCRDRSIFQVNEIYIDSEPFTELYYLLFEDGMFAEVRRGTGDHTHEIVVVERENGKFVELSMDELPIRMCSITAEKLGKGMELAAGNDVPANKVVFANMEKE